MSLDERLRQDIGQLAVDIPSEPINIGSDLEGVLVAGRRRRVLRKAYRGVAVATLLLVALFAVPSLLRSLGFLEITTDLPADDPPTEMERNDGLGITGDLSEKAQDVPRGGAGIPGVGGAIGGSDQQTTHSDPRANQTDGERPMASASTKAATPNPTGTYSYDVSGRTCDTAVSCESYKELHLTFDQPNGSRQRSSGDWRHDEGGRYQDETSYDFRPDGVYLESYNATYTNPQGAVTFAWACHSLPAPVRVWPTGAKPGDRFEYAGGCDANIGVNDQGNQSRTVTDIIRAETISIGGREVATLFIRIRSYQPNLYRVVEGWVFPDHFLFVEERNTWGGTNGFYRTLKSLTPN